MPHNGHLRGADRLLPGVREFWSGLAPADTIIVLTARAAEHAATIRAFFAGHGLRLDHLVTGCGVGERILFNDDKPSGLRMAHAVSRPRDAGLDGVSLTLDSNL